MEKVSLDAVESRMGPASVKRALAGPLGTDAIALNYYELAPGESFGFGYHRHPDQEEVFVVQSGTATFETEDGDVRVGAGEAIRFAPGEWQRGHNEGDERVVALALGAPQEMGDTDMLRHCEECGGRTHNYVEMTDDRDALVTRCEECDAETGRFT
ncbi:cupin [Haloarcula sp. CBA1115]|jgi:mannose-6-phosphate isomerase-like protein (cupin superfamily)|uniref:cupin domain-containing protein n=1 Tax=unclassified Haloarcula TaxID=2624677 RepID=UPI0005955600|nr:MULTISPECIES: cupin domain-containing protein [unclassified Haloarcula]AJF25831.1 cupin [Haloarcula sp. CBA1115]